MTHDCVVCSEVPKSSSINMFCRDIKQMKAQIFSIRDISSSRLERHLSTAPRMHFLSQYTKQVAQHNIKFALQPHMEWPILFIFTSSWILSTCTRFPYPYVPIVMKHSFLQASWHRLQGLLFCTVSDWCSLNRYFINLVLPR